MTLTEIFSDLEEVMIGDEKQIQSPFLSFLLNKKREFFVTHSIQMISMDRFNSMIILKGKKLFNGGLEWSEYDLKYTEEDIIKIYNLWLEEKRDKEINKLI